MLFTILNGDHTFGVKHPFDGVIPDDAKQVIEKTIEFLKSRIYTNIKTEADSTLLKQKSL